MKEERQCNYRNCSESLEGRRSNCKYCSRNHKTYEKIYRNNSKKVEERIKGDKDI